MAAFADASPQLRTLQMEEREKQSVRVVQRTFRYTKFQVERLSVLAILSSARFFTIAGNVIAL